MPDIPDEEKNGEAADYNDDYEDDFNPTRYRCVMVFALQGVCGQEVLILTEYVSFTFSFETVILAFLKTLMSSCHLVVSTAEVPRFVVRSLSSRCHHNQCHFRDLESHLQQTTDVSLKLRISLITKSDHKCDRSQDNILLTVT